MEPDVSKKHLPSISSLEKNFLIIITIIRETKTIFKMNTLYSYGLRQRGIYSLYGELFLFHNTQH